MAAPYNPPVKGQEFKITIGLEDMANPGSFKANPTIQVGDFKISKDAGAYADLSSAPMVLPAGSTDVYVQLNLSEMTADVVTITAIDQTIPKEWADFKLSIPTTS